MIAQWDTNFQWSTNAGTIRTRKSMIAFLKSQFLVPWAPCLGIESSTENQLLEYCHMSISIFEISIYRLTNGSHQTADFILYLYKEFIEFKLKIQLLWLNTVIIILLYYVLCVSIAFLVFVPMLLSNMVIMKR